VAGPLVPVWPPLEGRRTPGTGVDAVGVWPVSRALYSRRGGVAGPLGDVWFRGGVVGRL